MSERNLLLISGISTLLAVAGVFGTIYLFSTKDVLLATAVLLVATIAAATSVVSNNRAARLRLVRHAHEMEEGNRRMAALLRDAAQPKGDDRGE